MTWLKVVHGSVSQPTLDEDTNKYIVTWRKHSEYSSGTANASKWGLTLEEAEVLRAKLLLRAK